MTSILIKRILALSLIFLAPLPAGSTDETVISIIAGDSGTVLIAGDQTLKKWRLPNLPQPAYEQSKSMSMIALGRELFFDKSLSTNQDTSCASCHQPESGWADARAAPVGSEQMLHPRGTPSLFNLAYNTIFSWTGEADSLEAQALQPIFNPNEMGMTPEKLLEVVNSDDSYQRQFTNIFGNGPVTKEHISQALASFERELISRNTRFDQWIDGDRTALTASEVRGFSVFLDPDKGNCAVCHAPPNFTDNGFHNIGLLSFSDENPDLGRYNVRPVKLMRGAFKTPQLRNIALTAPYFHDGSAASIEDVINHYEIGGVVKTNLSPEMKELVLSSDEKEDLLGFLYALTEVTDTSITHAAELISD